MNNDNKFETAVAGLIVGLATLLFIIYNKFNRQRFDISPYCPKFIKSVKFLSYDLIFGSVGCENSKYICMMHV